MMIIAYILQSTTCPEWATSFTQCPSLARGLNPKHTASLSTFNDKNRRDPRSSGDHIGCGYTIILVQLTSIARIANAVPIVINDPSVFEQ